MPAIPLIAVAIKLVVCVLLRFTVTLLRTLSPLNG